MEVKFKDEGLIQIHCLSQTHKNKPGKIKYAANIEELITNIQKAENKWAP